ncbi:MAG: S-adenosylmethionine:tRNA ribosyltransferase-isomerase, partial [Opitutales bacterium]
IWRCLLKPGLKTQKAGGFSQPDEYQATVLEKTVSGEYIVRFELSRETSVSDLAERLGYMPLPPYVRRPAEALDEERYETVYADPAKRTATAAPTAGLHFTHGLLEELIARGHSIHDLTLSVGLGTFRPIETEDTDDHEMHPESYILPPETKALLRDPTPSRLAIGTTTVRAIEHYLSQEVDPAPDEATIAEADLFIHPPHEFLGVDKLLTNFHLPASTLLCLVAAFLNPSGRDGLKLLKELYAEALAQGYRFYSYGDAMLVL